MSEGRSLLFLPPTRPWPNLLIHSHTSSPPFLAKESAVALNIAHMLRNIHCMFRPVVFVFWIYSCAAGGE